MVESSQRGREADMLRERLSRPCRADPRINWTLDADGALRDVVKRLRRKLGDDAASPRYIRLYGRSPWLCNRSGQKMPDTSAFMKMVVSSLMLGRVAGSRLLTETQHGFRIRASEHGRTAC